MNPILEQKLRELIDEAERQAAPAMSVSLNLLLGAYLNGKHNEFAKHCSQLSPIRIASMGIDAADQFESQVEGLGSDTGSTGYIH